MKISKKILTFLLAVSVVLLFVLMPVTANAEFTDKVVTVDDNLTRIEADSTGISVAAGTTRVYQFTVPVSGSYFFAMPYSKDYKGKLAAIVKNSATGQNITVHNGLWENKDNDKYARLGNTHTNPISLEVDVIYELNITPDTTHNIPYIDVLRAEIPIDGKTVIPTYYKLPSNQMLAHFDCDDIVNDRSAVNAPAAELGTLIGDFKSDKLAAPSAAFPVITYLNTNNSISFILDVQTPGFYQFKAGLCPSGTWSSGNNTLSFSVNNGLEYNSDRVNPNSISANRSWLTSPAIYLHEGRQTLSVTNKAGSPGGIYFTCLVAEPSDVTGVVVNAASFPAELTSNYVSNITGNISADGITLNNGQSAVWQVKTAETSVNIYALSNLISEHAEISCKIDQEEEKIISLAEISSIYENKLLSEGTHTITVTAKTDGIVIKSLTLSETKTPVQVSAGAVRTKVDLTSGAIQTGSGNIAAKSGVMNPSSRYAITYNITDVGYYTVYVNAAILQMGFKAYFDGTDVTNMWYHNIQNGNEAPAKEAQDKKLAVPKYLSDGEHTFVLETTEKSSANLSGQIELRRVDGPLNANVSDGEQIIPAWDFVSTSVTNSGWYFSAQYTQGGTLTGVKGYEDFALRNVVVASTSTNGWTYAVTVPEDGLYDFGFYYNEGGNNVRVTVDNNPQEVYGTTKVSAITKQMCGQFYLTAGEHKITVSKDNVNAVFRMHALVFAKRNSVLYDTENNKAGVNVEFDSPVTGKVITAFYRQKELISISIIDAKDAKSISTSVDNLTVIPDSVKVMIWRDLESAEPLAANMAFSAESPEWTVK